MEKGQIKMRRISTVAAAALLAVLGGCQTSQEFHNNFGEWVPITREQAAVKVELPTGSSSTFEKAKNSSTGTIIEHFTWRNSTSFGEGVHDAMGPGYYMGFNYYENDSIVAELTWKGMKKLNGIPDTASLKPLEGDRAWVADLPQDASTGLICLTGVSVADRDADLMRQGFRRDTRGVTDSIRVFACGDAHDAAAFRSGFLHLVQSLGV